MKKEPYLKRNVILTEYTEEWLNKYNAESQLWVDMLNDNLVAIHHVGSTAIGTIKAKPIIDIMIVTKQLERLDTFSSILLGKGYEVKGENGISGRRYFQKDINGERVYHIHAYEEGHKEIADHILFRDYMRENLTCALEYEKLKMQLASTYPNDKKEYGKGKDEYIQKIIKKARARAETKGRCPKFRLTSGWSGQVSTLAAHPSVGRI
ncbi:MAG: GrpB family protein [Spirochaetota bacterium]